MGADLLTQHVFGTSVPIVRSAIVTSAFWCPGLEAAWVVWRWAAGCVRCSEEVACWATSSEQCARLAAQRCTARAVSGLGCQEGGGHYRTPDDGRIGAQNMLSR